MIIDIHRHPEQIGRYRVFDAKTGEEIYASYVDDKRGWAWCLEVIGKTSMGGPLFGLNNSRTEARRFLFSGPIRIEEIPLLDAETMIVDTTPKLESAPAPPPTPAAPANIPITPPTDPFSTVIGSIVNAINWYLGVPLFARKPKSNPKANP